MKIKKQVLIDMINNLNKRVGRLEMTQGRLAKTEYKEIMRYLDKRLDEKEDKI